jgi:hypothetical protein
MNPLQLENDSVRCWLSEGSLVIPVIHEQDGKRIPLAQIMYDYIKQTGQTITTEDVKPPHPSLIPAVVMVGEIIVAPKYADKFIQMLKSRDIHLPNT